MANYPRTEAQAAGRLGDNVSRIRQNAHKLNLMDRCMDDGFSGNISYSSMKELCDVSNGRTPDSVPTREVDLDSKEEVRKFNAEMKSANRLNRVENYTGLTISGNEDAKREFLDGGVERVLFKTVDVDRRSLSGIYIADSNETIGDIQKKFGVNTKDKDKLDGPMYDPNTNHIYLPRGEDPNLPNKLGHEIGHGKLAEWMREIKGPDGPRGLTHKDAGLGENFNSNVGARRIQGEMFDSASKHYEEVSADILMKERYGDHLAGEAVREKINIEFGRTADMVAVSFDRKAVYPELGRLSCYRAKAEIFGLSDIRDEIDSELKTQYGIDVNSSSDPIGVGINNLTNAYCGLQGLDAEKYIGSFKNIARMSIELDGGGKWIPPELVPQV